MKTAGRRSQNRATLRLRSEVECQRMDRMRHPQIELRHMAERKGSIRELQLPTRVLNRLEYEGIKTIRALLKKSPFDLLEWPGFGLASVKAVRRALEIRGESLKDDPGSHAIWVAYHDGSR